MYGFRVTNINDSGTGSLRDAISSPNRIIIFDVAGVINIKSRLVFSNNLYIAGQTAPGEGITIYGDGVSFSGANNIIVRHLRIRMGKNGSAGKDAAGIANGQNMIFDHVSVSWGKDENFSLNPSSGATLQNITIQNSIIGQGLLSHSAGGLIQAPNVTLYRNLYIDNSTRNAKVKGINQYVNNIVYNWSSAAYIMGGESVGDSYCNAVNNLFINGPSGGGNGFTGGNSLFHLYADGNYQDKNRNGIFDPYEIPASEYSGGPDFQSMPYDYPILPAWNAVELPDSLLPIVGASLPYRDYVDCYLVDQVLSFGTKGAFISDESSLPFGVPSLWNVWSGYNLQDTDNDGIPDEWEKANGTNFQLNDAMVIADNGYANIENYINSLCIYNRQFFLRAPVCFGLGSSTSTSLTFSWFDYTDSEDGFIIEIMKDGVFVEAGRTGSNANTITVTDGLTPATAYVARARSFKGDNYSDYCAEVTVKTLPEPVEMVDCDIYVGDVNWTAPSGIWDFVSSVWDNSVKVFKDDDKVLFNGIDADVNLDSTVSPNSIVARGDGKVNISGSGKISGHGSVNKSGKGELVMHTSNDYTGATVIHEGTFVFSELKNGGVASSIGASQEFAQNWIWNGGVWKYTGANTTTNRSANIYKDTELNISEGATVTMNGQFTGQGDFVLNGTGQLNPTENFFKYEGNTVLKGGTLYLSYLATSGQTVKLGSSPKLVMAGGTFKTKDNNDSYKTYDFPIEVADSTYSMIYVHRNCSLRNTVYGNGTLEYQVNYVREFIRGDWSDFTGRLVANGVGTSSDGSQLMIYNTVGFPSSVLETKGNVRVVGWATHSEFYLGGLSGASGTYLSGTSKNTTSSTMLWHIGAANTNETFRGVIDNRCCANKYNGTTSIIKEGSGDWRLTGANIYSGTTTIDGGRLVVNGTNSGTGLVTVNKDAILAGTGTVSGAVVIEPEGIAMAGDTLINSSHILKLKGGLQVNEGGVLLFPLYYDGKQQKHNSIKVTGALLVDKAVLKLDVSQITSDISSDLSFKILDISAASIDKNCSIASVVPVHPAQEIGREHG